MNLITGERLPLTRVLRALAHIYLYGPFSDLFTEIAVSSGNSCHGQWLYVAQNPAAFSVSCPLLLFLFQFVLYLFVWRIVPLARDHASQPNVQ